MMKLSDEFKVGIVVITALFILFWGLNFLKGTNLFVSENTYYAIYNRIEGLQKSSFVMLNGYKVGRVKDIYLYPKNPRKIIVKFAVEKEKSLKIPKGSVAKIASQDLLGTKVILLELSDSKEFLKDKDTLKSDIEASLAEEVNKQVFPIKQKAENLLLSIDSVVTVIQTVLNKDARKNLEKSFKSIKNALETFEQTSLRLDTLIKNETNRVHDIFIKVESILNNLQKNNENIANALKNINLITDSLAKANLVETIKNANLALKETAEVMEKIKNGEGSMGMLVNNEKLYNNLEKASNELDKLIKDIRINPERYVHFSIFGRRDKNKAKQ